MKCFRMGVVLRILSDVSVYTLLQDTGRKPMRFSLDRQLHIVIARCCLVDCLVLVVVKSNYVYGFVIFIIHLRIRV